jgi:hypothetical protein
MKFNTALTILTTMGSSAYVQAHPTSDNVFTMTNAAFDSTTETGNEVLMYNRNPDDGTIDFVGAFKTCKRLGWHVNFQTSRINNALITFSIFSISWRWKWSPGPASGPGRHHG